MARQKGVLPSSEERPRLDAWRKAIEELSKYFKIIEENNPTVQNYISRLGEEAFKARHPRYTAAHIYEMAVYFRKEVGFLNNELGKNLREQEEKEVVHESSTNDKLDGVGTPRAEEGKKQKPVGSRGEGSNGRTRPRENIKH